MSALGAVWRTGEPYWSIQGDFVHQWGSSVGELSPHSTARVGVAGWAFSSARRSPARLCTWVFRSLGMDEGGAGILDHHIIEWEGEKLQLPGCVESRRD